MGRPNRNNRWTVPPGVRFQTLGKRKATGGSVGAEIAALQQDWLSSHVSLFRDLFVFKHRSGSFAAADRRWVLPMCIRHSIKLQRMTFRPGLSLGLHEDRQYSSVHTAFDKTAVRDLKRSDALCAPERWGSLPAEPIGANHCLTEERPAPPYLIGSLLPKGSIATQGLKAAHRHSPRYMHESSWHLW